MTQPTASLAAAGKQSRTQQEDLGNNIGVGVVLSAWVGFAWVVFLGGVCLVLGLFSFHRTLKVPSHAPSRMQPEDKPRANSSFQLALWGQQSTRTRDSWKIKT